MGNRAKIPSLKGKQISRDQVKNALKKTQPKPALRAQVVTEREIDQFQWYVAAVTPGHEKRAVDRFNDNGVACVLAMQKTWRKKTRYDPAKSEGGKAFMPGYVCTGVTSRTALAPVWKMPGIVHGFLLVAGGEQPYRLASSEIVRMMGWGSIYAPPKNHAFMVSSKEYSEGDPVMARDGPFQNMVFRVQQIDGRRAMVHFDILGGAPMWFNLGDLAAV